MGNRDGHFLPKSILMDLTMWELSRYQLSVVAFSSSWVYFYQFVGTMVGYWEIPLDLLQEVAMDSWGRQKQIQLNFLWEAHSSWHFLSGEWSPPIRLSLPVSSGNVIEIQMQMFVYTHCQELSELLGDSWQLATAIHNEGGCTWWSERLRMTPVKLWLHSSCHTFFTLLFKSFSAIS